MDRWVQTASQERRWVIVALAVQLVLVVGMVRVGGLFHHVGMDFLTSYTAAEMIVGGDAQRLYDTRAQWEYQRPIIERYDVKWSDRVMHPYIAPPLLAVLTVPLLLLSPAGATLVWSLLNALAIASGTWLLARRLSLSLSEAGVVLVGSLPLFYVLMLGQIEGLLFLAMALFVTELRAGRDVRAGLALALFALKPPLLLAPLVYLAVTGRRRAVWTAAAAGTLQALLSVLLVGLDGVRGYFELSRRMSPPDGTIVTNVWGMVNIRAMVVRAFPADNGVLLDLVILMLTVAVLACAAWLWRRASDQSATAPALAILATTTVLTSYHALYHTAVIAMIGGVLLLAHARETGDEARIGRVLVASWLAFTVLPLAYYVVVQSSKIPAVLSSIGILALLGFAAQALTQQGGVPVSGPATARVELRDEQLVRARNTR